MSGLMDLNIDFFFYISNLQIFSRPLSSGIGPSRALSAATMSIILVRYGCKGTLHAQQHVSDVSYETIFFSRQPGSIF